MAERADKGIHSDTCGEEASHYADRRVDPFRGSADVCFLHAELKGRLLRGIPEKAIL